MEQLNNEPLRVTHIFESPDSSVVKGGSYDPVEKTLDLRINKATKADYLAGKDVILTYRFLDVPQEVYDDLVNAESKGAYFSRNIRNNYEWVVWS